jgi:hypothetical protein
VDTALGVAPDAPVQAPAPAPSAPTTPSREDVQRAMDEVRGEVASCGGGRRALANVRIVVRGATGRVSSALVEGELAGTPAGSCVALAVRRASFPSFEREAFTVLYAFRL